VSFAELRAFILKDDETATGQEIKLLFERMDKNKDGTVSKNEFTHFYSIFVTQKEDDNIRFAALDVDQSGNITRDELRKFMQREDAFVTEEQVKGLFDLMDRNKDGIVSKKEFLHRYTLNRKRFMEVDTDHSGSVSFAELHAFMLKDDETATGQEIKLLFERMDKNKDGTVSKNEFTHFYSIFVTQKEDDNIRFAALDVDQSGNITRDELRKFMQREDASVTGEQVKGLFDLMDRNKDGTVSKKELLHRYILQKRRFLSVDTDHSGDVSFDELRAFVLKEDEAVTEEKIKLLFERMDRNKDGTVSKNEFSHFYSLFKTDNFETVDDRRQRRLSKIRSHE
jgi:Ca2+-binding EF-hand superfamily protein